MDRGGRVTGSLVARLDQLGADALLHVHRVLLARSRQRAERAAADHLQQLERPSGIAFFMRRLAVRLSNIHLPRGLGLTATAALFIATGLYGAERGQHWPVLRNELAIMRDGLANAAGFRVAAVRISGQNRVSQSEIFVAAGITDTTSVLFFDPVAARDGLKKLPWIAEATVQKLYPDQLQIAVVEREAYALWQRGGKIAVIDSEGTVIVDYLDERFRQLPMVVGKGAEKRAREILDTLARMPALAEQTAAAVLVAESRWNLRLKNGIDVKLPDGDVGTSLRRLAALNEAQKLMTRDLTMIDLRLADRVIVRLSPDAFAAREAEAQARAKAKKKAGAA